MLKLTGVGLVLLALALPALAQGNRKVEYINGREAASNEVLVKFRPTTFQAVLQAEAEGDVDEAQPSGGAGVIRFHSRSKGTAALLSQLSARADVVYAEPNYVVHAIAIPNDPQFGQLWGLRNTGQTILGVPGTPGADISATLAWDVSTGSRANVATVVDTGIDYTHPDLAGNVWSAPTAFTVTIGGRSITCPAGSHGFNAINSTCNPLDDNDHGTHVSGTIGAVGNNGIGVAGVNWVASIMGSKFLDASGSGTTANAINAIEFAVQAKAAFGGAAGSANVRVLSNSWGGGGFSQALLDEINRANASDMLFVAAAGNASSNNDVTPNYPSNYNAPNVVAVAATDNTDALAYFSNYGATTVHLGAPGVDVLSTIRGANYAYFSGTSMATPHVSGAALLILSKCALTTANLKTNILNNVDPIASLSGITVTGGRLNVNKAIRACSSPATPDFSLSASPASQTVLQGAGTSYTATVTPSGGFTGTVTFSASGLPAGAAATFNPTSVAGSGSSTMSVTTSSTTPAGSYPLTITGVSGTLSHTASVTLIVTAAGAGDFSLSATPASQSIPAGASTTYTINITRTGGFTGGVTLSAAGVPAGATASFSPNPATGASSTLTVATSSATPVNTFTITITGTSGTLSRTTTATLTVTAAPCDGNCNN
jgi:subtilisin family serine protease